MLRYFGLSIIIHLAAYFFVADFSHAPISKSTEIKIKIVKIPRAVALKKSIAPALNKSKSTKADIKQRVPLRKHKGDHPLPLSHFMPSPNWAAQLEFDNSEAKSNAGKYRKPTPDFPLAEGFEYSAEFANKHTGRLNEFARLLLLKIALPEELRENFPLHRATLKLKQSGKIRNVKGSPYIRAFLNDQISGLLSDADFRERLKKIDNDFIKISIVNELRAQPHVSREPWLSIQGMHITLHFEATRPHAPGAVPIVETAEKVASVLTDMLGIFGMLTSSDDYDNRLKKYHSLPGFARPIR